MPEYRIKETDYVLSGICAFPKPPVSENHLEDTMLYSKRFYADRASLLSVDLGIEERYKPIMEKHIKFFANKERTQRFYDLEIENFNEENILIGLMSAVCKTRTCSFDEVIRVLLTDDTLEDNKFIADFGKFDLLESFWKYAKRQFGYSSSAPTLEKFVISMFVTYADRYISTELPKGWKGFVSYKSGNIIAFMDNLMNNVLYLDRYDELSAYVARVLLEGLIKLITKRCKTIDPFGNALCSIAAIDPVLMHPYYGIGTKRKDRFEKVDCYVGEIENIQRNFWLYELSNFGKLTDEKKVSPALFVFIAPRN